MTKRRLLMRIGGLLFVLITLAFMTEFVAASGGIVDGSVVETPYGTYNGVTYVQYKGRFVGTTAEDYSVGFEIVAPKNPVQGNGVVVMETMHVMGGTLGRDAYFTPEFLFGRGFSYAGIWWHPDDVDPFAGYSAEEANQIVHNFALALRQDVEMQTMVGSVKKVYGTAVSKANEPLLTMLQSPAKSLLDLGFLIVPGWPYADFDPPEGAPRIMIFATENDRIRSALTGMHTEALLQDTATFRSYEVAGGPHVADTPGIRIIGAMFGMSMDETTPLDWSPVMRALFVAGHNWVMEGTEPPPSTRIWEAPYGQIDTVYKSVYGLDVETGINRDALGNALGGIRMPDVEIGRGLYIASDPASYFGTGLMGAYQDLQCTPLEGGGPRFASHANYVSQYTTQANTLVSQRFLLQEDADRLIEQAAGSNVGDPAACTGEPILLPATGQPVDQLLSLVKWLVAMSVLTGGIGVCIRELKRKPEK